MSKSRHWASIGEAGALAGVIFAMEVVMMEYSLVSFAPIILSAVTATTLTRIVYGDLPVFDIPDMRLGSLLELPYVILMGIVLGIMAAMFIRVLERVTRWSEGRAAWWRFTLAGLCVGLIALVVPEVMGIGYDTVNHALLGQLRQDLGADLLGREIAHVGLAVADQPEDLFRVGQQVLKVLDLAQVLVGQPLFQLAPGGAAPVDEIGRVGGFQPVAQQVRRQRARAQVVKGIRHVARFQPVEGRAHGVAVANPEDVQLDAMFTDHGVSVR